MNTIDHDLDLDLGSRLTALEARAPGSDVQPPVLPDRRRRGRFVVSMAMAPVLVLAMVATTAAGAVVVSNLVHSAPGIQNPGQPLAGAHMECLTPRQAESFLAQHGFTDVLWQVESGDPVAANGGKGQTATVIVDSPPEHGYVIPGAILDDGRLHMIIDQRTGATGGGDCVDLPMP